MSDAQEVLEVVIGEVKYVFSEPPLNDFLIFCEDRAKIGIKDIFGRLVGIEGLKDATGKELSAEEVKGDYYLSRAASFATQIAKGFWAAWNKKMYGDVEADAKK